MQRIQRQSLAVASSALGRHPARYMAVFMLVAGDDRRRTAAEITHETGIELQAVYRAIRTFEKAGFFEWADGLVSATTDGIILYQEITGA